MTMATESLFFEASVEFEKSAAEVMLPEDANEWPNEIVQELFKQVPYIADFEPQVTMDRVDAERGYGFGHIEVQNKTEIQHGGDEAAKASAGVKCARIPIVVANRKLQPLDLLITEDSKVLPLTEARLRSVLFRPNAFDITGRGPGDQSMIGQLYPPYRQNYGMGGGGSTQSVGMGKDGSAQMPLLAAILSTINPSDHDAFFAKFAGDRGLQAAFVQNGAATGGSLKLLAEYEPGSERKLAGAVLSSIKPSAIQLCKEAEGYRLKTASHSCWLPAERLLDRGAALRLLGDKVVLAADESGSATMALGPEAQQQSPEEVAPAGAAATLISEYGIYKVQSEDGKDLIGYVFPNLIDATGTSLPMALFTNGSEMAIQGEIAGQLVDGAGVAGMLEGAPRGKGIFYRGPVATVPMSIKASMQSQEEGGVVFHAETFDGCPLQVMVQPNIQEITPSPDGGQLLIPEDFSWLPLDKAQETTLLGDPASVGQDKQAALALSTVQLSCNGGDSFKVSGFPLDKLAADDKQFLSLNQTMFLFAGLGTDLGYAQEKIGQAAAWSMPVTVRVGRYIKTAHDQLAEARVKAASALAGLPDLRKDLVKEAAAIPDPVAVDTVLSLGFINAENLGVFISYMPTMDEAQSKMCELLLAARLGLKELPGPALEKAIRSTEEAIEGLKILAFEKQ